MDFTPGQLFAGFLVSSVGFGVFLYGKKQTRVPQVVAGLVLMVFPGFVSSPLWIVAVGGAVLGGLWAMTRAGY